ncbi:hypothetical protein GCM10023194_39840 [Planotetraspora phitsanulokensis]|uniref:Uncharacterized protein n=1 Tax=Planotetraspora phitsanulokensis TaxID=575192 RepID=A0A8J3U9Z6_9ACTN|nr:hypothetical protein Pph01_64910 [Planotetraspora phitsanulokensis]
MCPKCPSPVGSPNGRPFRDRQGNRRIITRPAVKVTSERLCPSSTHLAEQLPGHEFWKARDNIVTAKTALQRAARS